MDFGHYQTFVFDCDGVILDSNGVKTEAFRQIAAKYGDVAAEFVAYHQANAGISRFAKIRHLHEVMLGSDDRQALIESDIKLFGELVSELLKKADFTAGVADFLAALPEGRNVFVISGGEQGEVRSALKAKQIDGYFSWIFGSPRPKNEILDDLKSKALLPSPAVYFGDAKFDHEMAMAYGMDFVFVSDYSEFRGWEDYFSRHQVTIVGTFSDL